MEDTLTILGCGWTLPKDIELFGIMGDVLAVNHAIMHYPGRLHHACMLDYKKCFKPIFEYRKHFGKNTDFILHARKPMVIFGTAQKEKTFEIKEFLGVTVNEWDIKEPNNSGIFAALVGKELGYKNIRLLGIPCDDGRKHFYDLMPVQYTCFTPGIVDFLEKSIDRFQGVKSACGWSAAVLGRIEEGK